METPMRGTFGSWCYGHVRAGVYSRHLRLWFRHHRADDVLLATSEDLFAQEHALIDQLMLTVLGSRSLVRGNMSTYRAELKFASAAPTNRPMAPETLAMLDNFYAPFNAELEELLGRPLGWGLPAPVSPRPTL